MICCHVSVAVSVISGDTYGTICGIVVEILANSMSL
jgi:hypothetical protein